MRGVGGGRDGDRRGAGALERGRGDVFHRGTLQQVVESEDVGEVGSGTPVHAHDERAPRSAVVLRVRGSEEAHETKGQRALGTVAAPTV